jgi:hypothetical protein
MRFQILLLLVLVTALCETKAQQWEWAITQNQDLTDIGKNIAVDKNKNIYVTGLVSNDANHNLAMKDYFWKFNKNGTLIWKQQLDDALLNSKMICDSFGNIYITASKTLERRDSTGNVIWSVQHPDVTNFSAMCEFPGGGVVLLGARKTDDLSKRAVVVRYDEKGACLWTVYSGMIGGVVVCNKDGKIYIAGEKVPDKTSINYGFVAKYDEDGNILSTVTIPHSPRSIVLDNQGNTYLTGAFARTVPIAINNQTFTVAGEVESFYIIKYDQNYSVVWYKIVTGSLWGAQLQIDERSNIYLSIFADQSLSVNGQSMEAGKLGLFLLKIGPEGEPIFNAFSHAGVNPYGGSGASAWDFCLDGDGDIYFTGSAYGNHFFGPHEVNCITNSDLFVAKLSNDDNFVDLNELQRSNSNAQFQVYPNPSGDIFTISGEGKDVHYVITDVRGQVIRTEFSVEPCTSIDLSPYARGVYFVQIRSGGKTETKKLVKN